MKFKYITLAFLFCCAFTNAQTKKEKKADDKFESYQYAEAIDVYERLIDLGYTSETIYRKLANSNYLNARYENAAKWYEMLVNLEGANVDPEEVYKYALSLKSIGEYEKSDTWMRKFDDIKQYDSRASLFENNTDYLKVIEKNSGRYNIKNLEINSSVSEFSPAYYNDKLVFSSARDTGTVRRTIHEWNNQPFLNLYAAQFNEEGKPINAGKLDRKLNKKTHESSAIFTKDGNTMYFTRNNSDNGRFARDKDGVSRLKLYRATKVNDEWKKITELPFNGDDFSVAHPALSPDETKLYFASDMPGTRGMSDLFVVDIIADGTFSAPRNLGNKINTESRETFPFVSKNNILYFASDGHPGLGGLDIFATQITNNFNDSYILNIGKPVNSKQDDFSLIFDEDTQKGFFASNRDGGKGYDDIYSFIQTKELNLNCYNTINGTAVNLKTGASIADAAIQVKDKENTLVFETKTDTKGNFTLNDICWDDTYTLLGEKIEFEQGTTSFTMERNKELKPVIVKLNPIKRAAPIGTDLTKYLKLDPIYFDLDKSFIRIDGQITMQQVFAYLKEYPEVVIEVRSHTDARATNEYNLALSNRRAKETVKYLLDNGIAPERVSGKGFGESELTNNCDSNSKCSEEEHQKNRRSEFIVVQN
ncbi:outer membrane protein OmpA-like peptidoglycan-associated protein [Cellulophaga sp. RHA_52]|uniref:OmpA family protein n=1 Tax=Cellulophaga sp. RHA_52 TaxID=1250036 RepID=UPI001198E2CB|nr:OmpA family protein [Cellulophaga sp. RHA_52]TVZ09506.1 outer membrane protein OmpA-like peptidoglycan-associated protein [Cellulophaga sp. RHA_52]TVZ09510.1 outer membrane protein OmpA-like peptidoglycan-associated protein [Cellulophaga sp. RHA_52]